MLECCVCGSLFNPDMYFADSLLTDSGREIYLCTACESLDWWLCEFCGEPHKGDCPEGDASER